MRTIPLVGLLLLSSSLSAPLVEPLAAQTRSLTATDSALVGRVLLAEDRRDAADPVLAEAARSTDARIRTIAWRARARIADPTFAARDSLPPLPAPPTWPEPAWRLRLRALASQKSNCAALRTALTDSAWAVRLQAVDDVGATCASDDAIAQTLRAWVDVLPADASSRKAGGVSWHAAAHSLVTLARVWPVDARPRLAKLATHAQWEVRMYAARAAAALTDSAMLRTLARDRNDDVRDAAIAALGKLTKHADDQLFLDALNASGAQVVRAAAVALTGSPRTDVKAAASAAFDRWVAKNNASSHDVRAALLAAAGRPITDDKPPAIHVELPPRAIALALGADVRLRVNMAPSSGGGSFVVHLRGDIAPMMAARVLELARSGYYNGLTWHRVEADFVIQGGSPGANEYAGYSQALRDELGNVPHVRGTIGMSTRGHDTGDAQWFVNLRDNPRLGRDYTVFAEVVDGIDVVDGILEGDAIESIKEIT
ncbi:MAG TPA: peptidylprolyl isomerase [Gemmatimonadaceae bacterium]|jgi:cyclophilin family peptidyl-prolyl cis-trans isomerase